MKLNLINSRGFEVHRAGWSYCIQHLKRYHCRSGIYVDDFIEKSFSWDLGEYYYGNNIHKIPYKFPWIGFLHNPPDAPQWFHHPNNPASIIRRAPFIESLKYCKCIVVLSDYLKEWLEKNLPVNVPVISVKHPTLVPSIKWSYRNFISNKNKNLVQIGYWLRDFDSICRVKVPNGYRKTWMPSNRKDYPELLRIRELNSEESPASVKNKWANTEILNHLTNEDYDKYLSANIGFVNLFDSSANNAIVECIARNTPILTNKIPAVVEYLGPDYPFYFNNEHDVFSLLNNEKILDAHRYLSNMNKDWITGEYFTLDLIKKLKEVL